jgi:iron complex outermembrane receptor protein
MTSKKPEKEFDARVRASFAEDETYTLNGAVGGLVNDDTLTWEINGDFRSSDGFFQDSYNRGTLQPVDGKIDQFENWSLGGRLIWEPSDKLSIDSKLRYGEVDAGSIVFNASFHLPALASIPGFSPKFAEDVNDHEFQWYPNVDSFNEQESTEFSVRAEYDLGWADLIGWGLYSDIQNNLGAEGTSGAFGFFNTDIGPNNCTQSTTDVRNTGFQLPPPQFIDAGNPAGSVLGPYTPTTCDGTQYQERNQKDYSFEVRLRSKDDERFRWEGGVYFLDLEREVGVNLGIDRGNGFIDRNLYSTNPTNPTEQLVWDQFDTNVYAIFGQVGYDVTDTFLVDFALRYDREERDVTNLVPTPAQGATTEFINCDGTVATPPATAGAPINPGLCAQLNDPSIQKDKSRTFDQWQPKLSARWDLTDNFNLFGSVGVGFKSGGFNNFGSEATVNTFFNDGLGLGQPGPNENFSTITVKDDYREETSTSAEIGFKSSFDNFTFEGAAYYMDVEDMQFFEFYVGAFGLLRVVSNIDEVEITGLELAGTWTPTDWLSLYANGNVLDSEIKKNQARPDTVGNKSPYTPDFTVAFGANVVFRLRRASTSSATSGLTWWGDTWFHPVQNQERPTIFGVNGDYSLNQRDTYTVTDLRLGIAGEQWSIVAFGTNIFEEDYLDEVIPAIEFGGSFIEPGNLRRFGVEATYRF